MNAGMINDPSGRARGEYWTIFTGDWKKYVQHDPYTPLSHRPTEGQNFVWGWVPLTEVFCGEDYM